MDAKSRNHEKSDHGGRAKWNRAPSVNEHSARNSILVGPGKYRENAEVPHHHPGCQDEAQGIQNREMDALPRTLHTVRMCRNAFHRAWILSLSGNGREAGSARPVEKTHNCVRGSSSAFTAAKGCAFAKGD